MMLRVRSVFVSLLSFGSHFVNNGVSTELCRGRYQYSCIRFQAASISACVCLTSATVSGWKASTVTIVSSWINGRRCLSCYLQPERQKLLHSMTKCFCGLVPSAAISRFHVHPSEYRVFESSQIYVH